MRSPWLILAGDRHCKTSPVNEAGSRAEGRPKLNHITPRQDIVDLYKPAWERTMDDVLFECPKKPTKPMKGLFADDIVPTTQLHAEFFEDQVAAQTAQ